MSEGQVTSNPLFQAAIQRILPHRYPFLLVDRVTEFTPGERIKGIKQFTVNDAVSRSGFSRASFVPGGILIETVTQLGAILVLGRPGMEGKVAVILQIPEAHMLKPVQMGETLSLQAEVVKLGRKLGELRGTVHCGEDLVADGRMRFAIADRADLLPE